MLMDNHVHLLITPGEVGTLSRLMHIRSFATTCAGSVIRRWERIVSA